MREKNANCRMYGARHIFLSSLKTHTNDHFDAGSSEEKEGTYGCEAGPREGALMFLRHGKGKGSYMCEAGQGKGY